MNWFWLNIPLGLIFVAAIAGIPLWMVLRWPDERRAVATGRDATPQSRPMVVVAHEAAAPRLTQREPARAGTGAAAR